MKWRQDRRVPDLVRAPFTLDSIVAPIVPLHGLVRMDMHPRLIIHRTTWVMVRPR